MIALISLKAAAAELGGCSERTVRRHLPVVTVGRRVFVRRSDLDAITRPAPPMVETHEECKS
jgi:hypothetical protein